MRVLNLRSFRKGASWVLAAALISSSFPVPVLARSAAAQRRASLGALTQAAVPLAAASAFDGAGSVPAIPASALPDAAALGAGGAVLDPIGRRLEPYRRSSLDLAAGGRDHEARLWNALAGLRERWERGAGLDENRRREVAAEAAGISGLLRRFELLALEKGLQAPNPATGGAETRLPVLGVPRGDEAPLREWIDRHLRGGKPGPEALRELQALRTLLGITEPLAFDAMMSRSGEALARARAMTARPALSKTRAPAADAPAPRRRDAAVAMSRRDAIEGAYQAVRTRTAQLGTEIASSHAALAAAVDASEAERVRARLDEQTRALRLSRDALTGLAKLGQKGDLAGIPGAAQAVAHVDAVLAAHEQLLDRSKHASTGRTEAGELDRATLEDLRKRVASLLDPDRPRLPGGPENTPPLAGTPLEKDLRERVAKVEELQARSQAEVAEREAAARMLAVADRLRGAALRRRRDGRDQLEFQKNYARLAMVMDLSYSLNVLKAAEEAVRRMDALLDRREEAIADRRRRSGDEGEAAKELAARRKEWEDKVRDKLAGDDKNIVLFADLAREAERLVARLDAYRRDVKGLLDFVDARDGGASGSAVAEYDRRLALLPELAAKRRDGRPDEDGSISKLSLSGLRRDLADVEEMLSKIRDGEGQLDSVPVEFAGVLIAAVPGVPEYSVSNPDAAAVLALLAARRRHWETERSDLKKTLDGVEAMLDAGNTRREIDDFGDAVPESLPVYKEQERAKAEKARADAQRFAAAIDEASRAMSAAGAPSLPALSGRTVEGFREILPEYAEKLTTLSIPDGDDALLAQIEKIEAARLLPFLGDAVIVWAQADATVEAIDQALGGVLPKARTSFRAAVAGVDAVLADVSLDESFVRTGFPPSGNQALIDRKRALLSFELKPMLEGLRRFLVSDMIPFQEEQIASADPNASGDSYAVLFKEKKNLYERIHDSYFQTMPWSLASQGAPEGDASAARANIEKQRADFQEYRVLVDDFLSEIRRRKDPANAETEEVFGETMAFSLVQRIAELSAERARRAAQIDATAAEVNGILAQLDQRTQGKHSLIARFAMPTGIRPDGSDGTRLRAFIDSRKVQDLAEILRVIGDEGLASGSEEGGLGVGGDGAEIPSGEQPPMTLPDGQHTAILALDAVKRLVPSTNRPGGDSLTETIARYLFTNGVIEASRESLEDQIPIFEAYLLKASGILDRVFSDLDADSAYVGSRSESAEALYARKVGVYGVVSSIAAEGEGLFRTKRGWDEGGFETVEDVASYYDSVREIHDSSGEALDAEAKALREFRKKLSDSAKEFADQRKSVEEWLRQLNDPHESAMRRIADSLSKIQDRTRAVLESNIEHHKSRRRFEGADGTLQKTLKTLDGERGSLEKLLEGVDLGDLPPDLADRVEAVGFGAPAWLAASPNAPQSLIIKKSNFQSFLSQLFAGFTPDSSARDIVRLREALLADPMALTQLLPNTGMMEIGDDPDGFYLVYNSEFSTPHGLETSSQVTLGNVLKLWDNNVSVVGHRFLSPPDATNAPYGDQGVTVRVESLQGENWVNYLDVTFHRLAQNIPDDLSTVSQMKESRMMVFEDFALMLADGKLYFGAAGFGDFSVTDPKGQPYFAGGNLKSSIKFNKIMSLNAEHAELFAKDPRKFLQTINLDFTGYDPGLDTDFVIGAEGETKRFRRDKVGVGVDLQQALDTADSFKLDVFLSQVSGTDDIDQKTIGATIVKGFAFEVNGVPVRTEVSGTGELGTEYNTGTVRASFELPNQGIVLGAEGKFLGDASSYLIELKKRMGSNTEVGVSYGSPHVGLNKRLTIGLNSTFTLGELWRAVAGRTGEDLLGGRTLAQFNKDLVDFFERDGVQDQLVFELKRVFEADVGRKLLTLEVGRLTREIEELRKAGAVLDNIKTRGFVGFVTNPVGDSTADRAAGGGFQVGTQTEWTMTKTQRALVGKRIAGVYAAGLLLQTRLLDLTERWQAAIAEILNARWEREIALYMAANSPDETLSKDGAAKVIEAEARLRQARLRYNMLSGRPPEAAFPFEDANPRDMDRLMVILGDALAQPKPLAELFSKLAPGALNLPEASFNLMDWIPWVEEMTLWFGVQFKDLLANQVLGGGISIRVPIYDPYSERRDKALKLEGDAIMMEMYETYRDTRLKAAAERREAEGYEAQIALLKPEGPPAAQAVVDAIRRYRNGLARQDELWAALRRWHWTMRSLLEARVRAALKGAWARLDDGQADSLFEQGALPSGPTRVSNFDSTLDAVESGDAGLAGLAKRSQAAAQLLEAAERRIEKVSVDLNIGANITATGIALIPAIGITGLGVYPVFSLRMKHSELAALEGSRQGAELRLAGHMMNTVAGDLALQFFEAYSAHQSGEEALAILEREMLPGASGQARVALRLRIAALRSRQSQLRAALNHLLGRSYDAPVEAALGADAALTQFSARIARHRTLDSQLAALSERVRIARAVETIVDKNLKVQDIRVDPVSLIGRSLGRLVAALSGSGDASPELVARARHATLAAERELMDFRGRLAAHRAGLQAERRTTVRALRIAGERSDADGRLQAVLLLNQLRRIDARLAMLGAEPGAGDASDGGSAPGSFAELENRLVAVLSAREPMPGLDGSGGFTPDAESITAIGGVRFFHARKTIGSDPINKDFIEGWVEVRLESRTTPPEALLALAALQRERADEIHRAALARAESRAKVLLGRMRLRAGLLRWARGRGEPQRALAAGLEEGLERDLAEVSAQIGTPLSLEGFLAIVPLEESSSPESAARALADKIAETNLEAMRSSLFPEGLPDGLSAPNASLQLQANLVAERMSYKGFTPVGAFGRFRGRWVSGAFLQAPDPERIQRSLEGILAEALRQELESRDRLKTLSLRLHSLMVAVSDGARLIEAQSERLAAARGNLDAALVLAERGTIGSEEAAAAELEVAAAWNELLGTFASVRMDFIRLVTELEALGQRATGSSAGRSRPIRESGVSKKAGAVREMAAYLAERLKDADFAAQLDKLFDGSGWISAEDRTMLAVLADEYRRMERDAELVRHHPGISAEERLALLTKADVEGRRRILSARLEALVEAMSEQAGGGRRELHRWLLEDLSRQSGAAGARLKRDRDMMARVGEELFKDESAEVRSAFRRIARLERDAAYARDALLESYLEGGNRPEDFLLKDRMLDAYLTALSEFDREVVEAYGSKALRESERGARLLNSFFDLRTSAERRRRLLTRGRGLLAADALIAIEEARLAASEWNRAAPDVKRAAASRIAHLRSLRERWLARPSELPTVSAELNADGSVARWLTPADVEGLKRAGRFLEAGGSGWILPPEHAGKTASDPAALGARRIATGADAAGDRAREAERAQEARREQVSVERATRDSDFALVGPDGASRGGLSLERLRELERQGRVLYFRKNPDRRSGLRRALHPVEARMADPDSVAVYVIAEGEAPAEGRYGSLESLLGSNEAPSAAKLQSGRRGYEAFAREAESEARRSLRMGWISLKLEGYAFALDAEGRIAAVFMNDAELQKARKDPERSKGLRFHLTSAIRWGIAPGGQLAEIAVEGVERRWRFGGIPETWISGPVSAVQLDAEGALLRVFRSDKAVLEAAKGWLLEDMSGRIWDPRRGEIAPIHRLRRYLDPEARTAVRLGRSFLERRKAEAEDGLDDVDNWGTNVRNWPDIVLEIPRGIVQTPIEIITGRDPNQHGYIGRVYMYRGDGGATVRRGVFGKIVHFIDFLDILPDPVDRYQDPSQYPDRVRTDGALLPGEWVHEKDPRTAEQNIHFGTGAMRRAVQYAEEDLEDARGRILAAFQGGVRETFLETVRGRAGVYPRATLRTRVGGSAVRGVLKDAGGLVDADGDGALDSRPGHIEVDRVRADLEVRIGAEQHAERARAYREMMNQFKPLEAPLRDAMTMTLFPLAALRF